MTSLSLPSAAVDSCQSNPEDPRRSSVHSTDTISRTMPKNEPTVRVAEELQSPSALDTAALSTAPSMQTLAGLPTPMSHVHMSEYSTITTLPRHSDALPNFSPYDNASPYSSVPQTAYNSRAPSPEPDESKISRYCLHSIRWRLASGYFAFFVGGWGDGVTGTVMPYLRADYHLTTMTSSLLWAGTTCGFFLGTLLVESILKWLGRLRIGSSDSKYRFLRLPFAVSESQKSSQAHSTVQARHLALMIASSLHALYFIFMGTRSGFPLMFVAYAMAAFARALLTAPLNSFFASGPKQALGYAYGLASFGSVASPLVCQALIATGIPWQQFYFGSLLLSGLNILFLTLTFRPSAAESAKERQGALSEARLKFNEKSMKAEGMSPLMSSNASAEKLEVQEKECQKSNTLKLALRMPYQWAFSFFILMYCGSETTTQGFMVTYLLGTRHANPKTVGYITSGFWGGISLGRFVWGYCTPFLNFTQRKYAVHACIVIALVLQILIWVIKSYVQNSIAASFIGFFYGPIFPATLAMANDILPEEVHMVVMALINAFSSLGGAIFPFVAGTILSIKGNNAFTFVTVPLAGALVIFWSLFPSRIPTKLVSVSAVC